MVLDLCPKKLEEMMPYIGVDIGGTKIAGGIVTNDGNITAREERPTPLKEGGHRILQEAIEVARAPRINTARTQTGRRQGSDQLLRMLWSLPVDLVPRAKRALGHFVLLHPSQP